MDAYMILRRGEALFTASQSLALSQRSRNAWTLFPSLGALFRSKNPSQQDLRNSRDKFSALLSPRFPLTKTEDHQRDLTP
jgi:hypothetical protein